MCLRKLTAQVSISRHLSIVREKGTPFLTISGPKSNFYKVYLAKRKSDNAEFAVKTFQKDLLLSADKAKVINVQTKLNSS